MIVLISKGVKIALIVIIVSLLVFFSVYQAIGLYKDIKRKKRKTSNLNNSDNDETNLK